jgi:tRNA U55 pseudouridine synthase TruB
VRSLANDIAGALGGSAHLTSLRRTKTGSLDVDDHGIGIDELANWESRFLTPSEGLIDLPSIIVNPETEQGIRHGMKFIGCELSGMPEGVPVRVENDAGDLLAVYRRDGDASRPEVVLPT